MSFCFLFAICLITAKNLEGAQKVPHKLQGGFALFLGALKTRLPRALFGQFAGWVIRTCISLQMPFADADSKEEKLNFPADQFQFF